MPQTLNVVLDQFGPPPPEIALDWARQLAQIAATAKPDNNSDEHELPDSENLPVDWSRLTVTDSGEIAVVGTRFHGDEASAVRSFCLNHATQLVWWADDVSAGCPPLGPVSWQSLVKAIDTRVARLQANRHSQRESNGPTGKEVAAKRHGASRLPRSRLLVVALMGVSLLGVAGWLIVSSLAPSPTTSHAKKTHENSTASHNRLQVDARGSETNSPADLVLSEEVLGGHVAPVDSNSNVANESQTRLDPLSQLSQLAEARNFAPSTNEPNASRDASFPSARQEDVSIAGLQSAKAQDEMPVEDPALVDVADELEKLEKPINEDVVTTVQVSESESLHLPALSVIAFPSHQTVKLELPRTARLRKPEFELELHVADSFVTVPSGLQRVTASQGVLWQVRLDDDESRVTVLVAGRVVHGRTPTLRFQVSASSPDAPGVVVPLSKDYLSRAEALLAEVRNRLSVGIDAIQRSYNQAPRELRSVMTSRRKAAEQQLKIAEDLFALATQARRIEALLDGQFELHGRIVETVGTSPTVIATIGKPTTIATTMKADD